MSNLFKTIIDKPKKKAATKKKATAKKPVKKKPTKAIEIHEPLDTNPDPLAYDMSALVEKAQEAKLLEPILKNEALTFKNEKAKVELQKQAGELIEFSLAEFLFIGYMEKCNGDLLSFMKRIRPKIINLIKENNQKGVEKLIMKEIKGILIGIKKQQADDVIRWNKER